MSKVTASILTAAAMMTAADPESPMSQADLDKSVKAALKGTNWTLSRSNLFGASYRPVLENKSVKGKDTYTGNILTSINFKNGAWVADKSCQANLFSNTDTNRELGWKKLKGADQLKGDPASLVTQLIKIVEDNVPAYEKSIARYYGGGNQGGGN